jgi:hypothetical protein
MLRIRFVQWLSLYPKPVYRNPSTFSADVCLMEGRTVMGVKRSVHFLVLTFVAFVAGMGLSGCDDHVTIDRDPSVPIHKGMTWAWRPSSAAFGSDRRVASRNVLTQNREYRRNPDWENDMVRNRIARAFEQNLNAKGLVQVSDPANADFLVDFQFGVHSRRERVATPVYSGGLVCGYYGCWNGFYGPPGVVVHTVRFHEGTIVFDLVERDRNRLAYRAVRENIVTRKSFRQDEVNEGAKHLLKGLKPTE